MPYKNLTVVTTSGWVARDLTAAGTIQVTPEYGFDVPAMDGSTAIWCSGAWAMRLAKSGISHPFRSTGPAWLTRVPERFLRRSIWAGTLDQMPVQSGAQIFCKLSEHKHSAVPADLYPGTDAFAGHVRRALSGDCGDEPDPSGISVTLSAPLSYRREFRCFIAYGRVAASSIYLSTVPGVRGSDVQITWDAYAEDRSPDSSEAAVFAQAVADAMGSDQPPGYTLDVGTDHDGNFSVIEANAAWSSNIYHARAAGVIESVLAAQDPDPAYDRWNWIPDRAFYDRARALPAPA